MSASSFNPQIFPASMTPKEHHRSSLMGLWAVLVVILLGLAYWYMATSREEVPAQVVPVKTTSSDARTTQSIIGSLRSAAYVAPSKETATITKKLTTSKTTVSSSETQDIINQLKNPGQTTQ